MDYQGFDPDIPTAGFYRTRLRAGCAYVGVRIFFDVPREPWSGEEMDRAPRWQAEVNGVYEELDRVWPRCAGEPITEHEYRHLIQVQRWAEQHAAGSGLDDPGAGRRINPLTSPIVF